MNQLFCPSTELLLEKFPVVKTAMDRFHGELHWLYEQLGRAQEAQGLGSSIYRSENGRHLLQIYRLTWPNSEGEGLHFEFFVDLEEMGKGRLVVGLDLHENLDGRSEIRSALVRILEPFAEHLLRESGLRLRSDQYWKLLHGSLALRSLTIDSAEEKTRCLPDIVAAVDEALCLAGGTTIWRTVFGDDHEKIRINWFGSEGGQGFEGGKGRFASRAMKIDGTRTNARKEHMEAGNLSVLVHPMYGIANAMDVYVCVVVKTSVGGTIQFKGDAHRGKTAEGYDIVPLLAFNLCQRVEPSDRWQCIFLKAKVAGSNEINYDFAKEGTWVVMNVVTEDREFLFDSIEIGWRG